MAASNFVKELRERTGSGVKACQEALVACNDDMEKAIEHLRKKGLADASKKSGKETGAGGVFSYIHAGNKIGVMLQLNCETDFVANTEQFKELGKDLCMHVCASRPVAVKRENIPQETIEREKGIYTEQVKDKPEAAREKIIQGKLEKFYQDMVLMEQPFVKDDKLKVEDLIKEKIAVLKENIVIKRFVRFEVGEKA
jgi:elongation factor Ts